MIFTHYNALYMIRNAEMEKAAPTKITRTMRKIQIVLSLHFW